MRFVVSGGGTAGHINPALALAEELQARGHEVQYAGTSRGVEARLVQEAGIPFKPFEAQGFNRSRPLSLVPAVFSILRSTGFARSWLREVEADAVVCFGGYVCIPVGRAAKKLKLPLVVHEQNSVMGLANKYLGKAAAKVALTYEESALDLGFEGKTELTGNPVRASVLKATRSEGRSYLNLPERDLVLLVFGGSLGARHINQAIIGLKEELLSVEGLSLVHITGPKEYETVRSELALTEEEQKRWKLFGYQDRMGETLAAADIVLSRAGATSLAEITALQIPALLIPYAYAAENHQTKNASAYTAQGAACMIADDDLGKDIFKEKLFSLIRSDETRCAMKEALAHFSGEKASARLADVVIATAEA